jgi:hypothetical protein
VLALVPGETKAKDGLGIGRSHEYVHVSVKGLSAAVVIDIRMFGVEQPASAPLWNNFCGRQHIERSSAPRGLDCGEVAYPAAG